MQLLRMPSRKTFEKLVRSLDPFWVKARREGPQAAQQLFRITAEGVDVERPGERVEIDEWKVDLMVLLTWLRVADKLSERELKAVARARLWVSVAIDCATRCILGMRFSARDPSAESSMAVLEQVFMDKSEIAFAAGTSSPWFQCCSPETVVTDTGAAFIATRFRTALAELRIEHMMPPPGQPRLRPFIESFFKSCREFLSWYEGRTFSDYIEKGDYDPEKNATVSADLLNGDFVRAIVDQYHNTPHVALQGETPLNAWLRLSQKYGVLPLPAANDRRRIFGIPCQRKIGDKGVRVLGLHYQSAKLQQLRVHHGIREVEVRFDRFDLSHVEVRADKGWITVPNRFGLPQGVSIWEWVGAARQLADIHAKNAALTRDTMLQAINALRKSGEAAAARAELGRPIISERYINSLDRQLFSGVEFSEEPRDVAGPLQPLAKPDDAYSIGLDLLDGGPAAEPEDDGDFDALIPDEPGDQDRSTSGQFGVASKLKFNR